MNKNRCIKKRFWSNVDIKGKDECWFYNGSLRAGYGAFWINGKTVSAHRIAWQLLHGKIKDGFHVLHTCDNKPCCNPFHLYEGTHTDNMHDKILKGRMMDNRGIKHYSHKLNEQDVICIRILNQCGYGYKIISRLYGRGDTTIRDICKRKTWRHI
jgi:hypothetical protein